tara:strand:- start:2547 stop:2780 length:234 start_codon:yes stop_codon:yes gene_type:complete
MGTARRALSPLEGEKAISASWRSQVPDIAREGDAIRRLFAIPLSSSCPDLIPSKTSEGDAKSAPEAPGDEDRREAAQ